MKAELRALRGLSRENRGSLARAWAYLLVANLALRFLPVSRAGALLGRLGGRPRKRPTGVPADRLARLVAIAGRHHLLPMTCLPRSLALQALLRRQGIEAELRIGVRREAGELRAHAWVEQAGAPVGEPADVELRFQPLAPGTHASRF